MDSVLTTVVDSFAHSTKFRRPCNQDRAVVLHASEVPDVTGGMWMAMVCDGTSDSDGELAAGMTVRAAYPAFARLLAMLPQLRDITAGEENEEDLVNRICRIIFPEIRELMISADKLLRAYDRCACTVSVAVVYDGYVYTGNLGDSPIWLLRDREGEWEALSLYSCHNAAGEALRRGEQPPRGAASLLHRWVGSGANVSDQTIATGHARLEADNILLLGSDGALDIAPTPELTGLITACGSMKEVCRGLLQRRVESSDTDNFTLIAARVALGE